MPSLTAAHGTDPESCQEFGYGLGDPGGILILRYLSAGALDFGATRQDFLHQMYWSPDGPLSAQYGAGTEFVGPSEALWAHRAVTHAVHAGERQTVYRLCLRELPAALTGLRFGAVSVSEPAGRLIQAIATPGYDQSAALEARTRIMAGLGGSVRDFTGPLSDGGPGFALRVARALSHDPCDPTRLDEWAARLHISVKTLQRDFRRQFGVSFSAWRADLRLRASLVLLDTHPVGEVAHRVGYSTASAYIAAFTRTYGHTPGRHSIRRTG